jgi:hypothetical protein
MQMQENINRIYFLKIEFYIAFLITMDSSSTLNITKKGMVTKL